jgi:hypothetical protein
MELRPDIGDGPAAMRAKEEEAAIEWGEIAAEDVPFLLGHRRPEARVGVGGAGAGGRR